MSNSKGLMSLSRLSLANELYRLRFCPNPNLKMVSASRFIPKHRGKPEGEDAHFICDEKNTIGLADGVGGLAKHGIDSGVYARQLMKNAYDHLYYDPEPFVEPHRILSSAFAGTKAKGASTACIVTVKDNNLKVEVEVGDIIIAGTDGLFDNMFSSEIREIIKKGTIYGVNLDALALKIANQARINSYDKFKESPFAKNAKAAGKHRVGGKIDDITVIISHIVYESVSKIYSLCSNSY